MFHPFKKNTFIDLNSYISIINVLNYFSLYIAVFWLLLLQEVF